jgi:HEAT repeat protein
VLPFQLKLPVSRALPGKMLMLKLDCKIVATLARVALVLIALVTFPPAPRAQAAGGAQVIVSAVSTRTGANGTVVSIAADASLSRAQTWQDRDGYHVVVPGGAANGQLKVANGIKVTQLDNTLEIVLQTKPNANVSVRSSSNHLHLAIEGKLESRTVSNDSARPAAVADVPGLSQQSDTRLKESSASESFLVEPKAEAAGSSAGDKDPIYIAQATAPGNSTAAANTETLAEEESGGFFQPYIVTIIFVLLLIGALVLRWRQSKAPVELYRSRDEIGFDDFDDFEIEDEPATPSALVKGNGNAGANGASAQRKAIMRQPAPVGVPQSLYGAFQVDQEVAKLVMGQPHKMEVLASRAPDDRRAIEASLLKALASHDDSELRRVRDALEEYGFVARQNAAVLMAADPYDRTSAARMLGAIQSPSALPFLLEALYDNESIVRNQAVLSIGELKLPSAIGALLDIARKHTDVPGALLSRALSACSVEGLDFFDSPIPEPHLLSGHDIAAAYEMQKLKPASAVQELPHSTDEERFVAALAKLESPEIVERAEGVKWLAQFAVSESVAALARVARRDVQPNLRALAIGSLATINHESVFPSVLIGMADESREVRAAAARSLSRLSFDRADAYMRVIDTDDEATLRDVAEACVKAGVAAQAIDRLVSTDRRQACEALSLVSLLAKARVLGPIIEAIESHPGIAVRICALRLLAAIGQPGVAPLLKEIPTDLIPESVGQALSETIAELEEIERNNASAAAEFSRQTDAVQQSEQNNAECAQKNGAAVEATDGAQTPGGLDAEAAHSEISSFDFPFLPEEHQPLVLENEPQEPQSHLLECLSDQPPTDTSGLPALPIA